MGMLAYPGEITLAFVLEHGVFTLHQIVSKVNERRFFYEQDLLLELRRWEFKFHPLCLRLVQEICVMQLLHVQYVCQLFDVFGTRKHDHVIWVLRYALKLSATNLG